MAQPASPGRIHAARPAPLRWFVRGGWYLLVVVLSFGMLSFVPFVHAATRTRTPLMWLWAVLYTAAVVALFAVVDTADAGGLLVGLTIVAAVHSVVLRGQVWPRTAADGPGPTDPAIAAALAARARREEARRLAATDPQLARELRIGRPDLARDYDDGGLVDLNSASPEAIAATCGIDLASATLITDARAAGVGFSGVDDVFSLTAVPYPLWDRIRDRAVAIVG